MKGHLQKQLQPARSPRLLTAAPSCKFRPLIGIVQSIQTHILQSTGAGVVIKCVYNRLQLCNPAPIQCVSTWLSSPLTGSPFSKLFRPSNNISSDILPRLKYRSPPCEVGLSMKGSITQNSMYCTFSDTKSLVEMPRNIPPQRF